MKKLYEVYFNELTKKVERFEKIFKQIVKIEGAYNKLKQKEASTEDRTKLEKGAMALKEKLDEYIKESKSVAKECNSLVRKIKGLPHYNSKELKRLKRRLKFLEV